MRFLILMLLACVMLVCPVSAQEYSGCIYGPLALGLDLAESRKIMGSNGFAGRDDVPAFTGLNFISPSNKSVATLIFDRDTRELITIEVSAEASHVSGCARTAEAFHCKNWEANSFLENWVADQEFRIGDSIEHVLEAHDVKKNSDNLSIRSLLVHYDGSTSVEKTTETNYTFGTLDNGDRYLYVQGHPHPTSHSLSIKFDEGVVSSITLSVEPIQKRARGPGSGTSR